MANSHVWIQLHLPGTSPHPTYMYNVTHKYLQFLLSFNGVLGQEREGATNFQKEKSGGFSNFTCKTQIICCITIVCHCKYIYMYM